MTLGTLFFTAAFVCALVLQGERKPRMKSSRKWGMFTMSWGRNTWRSCDRFVESLWQSFSILRWPTVFSSFLPLSLECWGGKAAQTNQKNSGRSSTAEERKKHAKKGNIDVGNEMFWTGNSHWKDGKCPCWNQILFVIAVWMVKLVRSWHENHKMNGSLDFKSGTWCPDYEFRHGKGAAAAEFVNFHGDPTSSRRKGRWMPNSCGQTRGIQTGFLGKSIIPMQKPSMQSWRFPFDQHNHVREGNVRE